MAAEEQPAEELGTEPGPVAEAGEEGGEAGELPPADEAAVPQEGGAPRMYFIRYIREHRERCHAPCSSRG